LLIISIFSGFLNRLAEDNTCTMGFAFSTIGTLLGVDPIFRVVFLGDVWIWGRLKPKGGFLSIFEFFDSTTLLAS
jgi:hypothetical protein